jgi:hypothetical protein
MNIYDYFIKKINIFLIKIETINIYNIFHEKIKY